MGSLLKHACQVAEADAPADEAVPVGVAVKVVVDNLGEAQDDVPEEGSVLHHVGVGCGDRHQPCCTLPPPSDTYSPNREQESRGQTGSPVPTDQRQQ